jgi:anthranilate synthase component 1
MKTPVSPSLDEFVELAKRGNVIPVFSEFVADTETPISAFHKIGRTGQSFLFESTEKNDVSGRFSFVGTNPHAVIRRDGDGTHVYERGGRRHVEAATDPLDELRKVMARYQAVPHPELSPLSGGAVGFLGYDAVSSFEKKVPMLSRDELDLPEMLFLITGNLLVFDHRLRRLKIIVNAFIEDGSPEKVYADAVNSIEHLVRRLGEPAALPTISARDCDLAPTRSNVEPEQFEERVTRAKEYIAAGDIFQVVLSQRFESDFNGDTLDFYRCLRFINPSPYMFCLNFGQDFALVGSSPEMHVRVQNDVVEIRPIAGTRPRGSTASEDEQNAADLLADPKERAEHIMLVDLARNDIGRIAEPGTVRVSELMNVERYSHVMHIVSHVTGRLRSGSDGLDVLKATFPAGTVSGAPKIRAMQIISELEKTRRGCYAGAVGYVGFDGNVDSCIVLRSAVLKNAKAYYQTGAGIVADSDPRREYEESMGKARAMRHALALASGRGIR